MTQELFNWILGGFGALLGFIVKSVWDAVKDLQESDKQIVEKVNSVEVLVAGQYVKQDEFKGLIRRID